MQKHITDTVFSVLAHSPESRDNDLTLWLLSLQKLEGVFFDSDMERILRKYPQTSFVRERARIQNKYGQFQATDKVRVARIKKKHNILTWLFG